MNVDANSMNAKNQALLKEVGYEDDDSDEEEQNETEALKEEDISKILTINKYLVKEASGAKDSEKRKLAIHVRIRDHIKVHMSPLSMDVNRVSRLYYKGSSYVIPHSIHKRC